MTPHTRIGLLVVLVLIAGVIWGSIYMRPVSTTNVSAKVVSADAVVKTVTIQTTRGEYVLPISEHVVIKSLTSEGLPEGMFHEEELNIYDLHAGEAVTISTLTPFTEGDTDFPRVKEIVTNGGKDTKTQSGDSAKNEDIFTQAKVSKIDFKKQGIEYGAVFLNSPKSLVFSMGVARVPVFSVTDPLRAHIVHARKPAAPSDLKVGDSIVIHFRVTSSGSNPVPVEIVLIKNK